MAQVSGTTSQGTTAVGQAGSISTSSINRFNNGALRAVLANRAQQGTLHVFTSSSIPDSQVQPNKA